VRGVSEGANTSRPIPRSINPVPGVESPVEDVEFRRQQAGRHRCELEAPERDEVREAEATSRLVVLAEQPRVDQIGGGVRDESARDTRRLSAVPPRGKSRMHLPAIFLEWRLKRRL
jgi:hypothetical protein